jgi:hypothetical protein
MMLSFICFVLNETSRNYELIMNNVVICNAYNFE